MGAAYAEAVDQGTGTDRGAEVRSLRDLVVKPQARGDLLLSACDVSLIALARTVAYERSMARADKGYPRCR
jgi:hypothetical protein